MRAIITSLYWNLIVFTMVLVTCSSIGCKKKDTKNSETIDFIIENIQDIDIKAGHSSDLQLDIKGIASLQEIVSLETIGLPDNVAATYSASKGFPSYSSIVTFRAGINAVVGDYPIKIRGASPSTGPKEYELTLHLHDGDFFYLGRAGFNVRSVFSNSPDDTYDTYVNSSSVMGFRTSFLGSAPPPVGKYKIVPHPYSSMEVGLSYTLAPTWYYAKGTDNKYAEVFMVNGKIRIEVPEVIFGSNLTGSCSFTLP